MSPNCHSTSSIIVTIEFKIQGKTNSYTKIVFLNIFYNSFYYYRVYLIFWTNKRTCILLIILSEISIRTFSHRKKYLLCTRSVLEIQFRVEGRERRRSRDSLSCEEPFHKSARSIASPWRHLSGPAARHCPLHSSSLRQTIQGVTFLSSLEKIVLSRYFLDLSQANVYVFTYLWTNTSNFF